jgi:hypothetical protein
MESPAYWTLVLDFVATGLIGLSFLVPPTAYAWFNKRFIDLLGWLGKSHQRQLGWSIVIGLAAAFLGSVWVAVEGVGCDWDNPFPTE